MKWSEVKEQFEKILIFLHEGWTCPAGYGVFDMGEKARHSDDFTPADAGPIHSSIYVGYENPDTPKENSIYFYAGCADGWFTADSEYEDKDVVITGDMWLDFHSVDPKVLSKEFIKWALNNDVEFTDISGTEITIELDEEETIPPVEQLRKLVVDTCDAIRTKKGTTAKINTNDIPSEILSISGAALNIHYGQTAPEDTSKLWIKCNEPSKVEIANKISGGNETLDFGINALPKSAYGIASATVGTKIYLFGGSGGLNTINIYDTETNTITTSSTTLPTGASYIASAVVGTKVYLFGGEGSSSINIYNTETNTIETSSTTLPTKTYGMASATVGTKVYLFGGFGSSGGRLSTINIYDTKTNTITTLSLTLPKKARYIASAVVGTKVYLFGGDDDSSYYSSSINVYDTETNTITTSSTTLPTGAYGIASAVVGTKVYLFGGYSRSSRLNTINVYDTENNTITTLSTTLPTSATHITSAVVGTKVYLFGGEGSISSSDTINRFNVAFDVNNNTLALLNQLSNNKVSIIKTDNIDVKIGIKTVLLGDENNEGQNVPFAIYNGSEWVEN